MIITESFEVIRIKAGQLGRIPFVMPRNAEFMMYDPNVSFKDTEHKKDKHGNISTSSSIQKGYHGYAVPPNKYHVVRTASTGHIVVTWDKTYIIGLLHPIKVRNTTPVISEEHVDVYKTTPLDDSIYNEYVR